MLAALLSLVRAFRPYRQQAPSDAQCVYLVRSQEVVVLTVLLTLLADMIAMVRHLALWSEAGSSRELIVLLCSVAVIALAVQLRITSSQTRVPNAAAGRGGRAVFTTLLATSVLAVYPEQLINHTGTHLFTVVIAAFVLFDRFEHC
jgi:hypothetical protein